jgi:hypothetical protein
MHTNFQEVSKIVYVLNNGSQIYLCLNPRNWIRYGIQHYMALSSTFSISPILSPSISLSLFLV